LKRGLQGLTALGEKRAGAWREAAHDLRGSVGVLQTVSTNLDRDGAPEACARKSLQVLKRGVHALHELLSDLVDLAALGRRADQLYLRRLCRSDHA